jgi:hypothetical protein
MEVTNAQGTYSTNSDFVLTFLETGVIDQSGLIWNFDTEPIVYQLLTMTKSLRK